MSHTKEKLTISDLQLFVDGKGSREFGDYKEIIQSVTKFMESLSDGKQTISLKELRKKIQTMPIKDVERAYNKHSQETLTFNQIMSRVDKMIMFLEMFKQNNQAYFVTLHKKSQQFVKFLDELKHEKAGSTYDHLVNEIYEQFHNLDQLLKVMVDTGKPLDYEYSIQDANEDPMIIMGNRLRMLKNMLKDIHVKKGTAFKNLVEKYGQNISQTKYTQSDWNQLLKIIKAFPLYASIPNLSPEQFTEFIAALSSFVRLPGKTREKKEIVQKIKMLFEKVSTKMKGGASQVQQVREQNYERLYLINIFKEQVQVFYYDMATCIQQTAEQRFVPAIKKIGYIFRPVIQDMQQIYRMIINQNQVDQNFTDFIQYINGMAEQQFYLQQEQGIRIYFENIMFKIKKITEDCKEIEDYHQGDLKDFVGHFKKLHDIIASFVKYLKNIEKMKDIDVEKLNSISLNRQKHSDIHKKDVPYMIQNILNIYENYLSAYQMYTNIDLVQQQIKSLKSDTYQENTMNIAKNQVDKMNKYYEHVRTLYNDPEVKYDPVLASYMQIMTLRFQQCEYISKGISSSPSLNPRYIGIGDVDDPQEMQRFSRIVGITEELGEGQFKTENTRYTNIEQQTLLQMPVMPDEMMQLEFLHKDDIVFQNRENMLLYQTKIQNANIMIDIIRNPAALTYAIIADDMDLRQNLQDSIPVNPQNSISDNQIDRIYNTFNVLRGPGVTQQQLLDALFDQLFQILPHGPHLNQKTVSCFDDAQMKEYLLPEMQVPFMQPLQKVLYYNTPNNQLDINTNNLNNPSQIGSYITPFIGNTADHCARLSNYYDASHRVDQNLILQHFMNGNLNFRQGHEFEGVIALRDLHEPMITSILGIHNSMPIQHFDSQSFGCTLEDVHLQRMGHIRNITEQKVWGLLDYIPRGLVYQHNVVDWNDAAPFANNLVNHQFTSVFNFGEVCPRGQCQYGYCNVFKDGVSKHLQYQIFMAQHLQYFTLQNVRNIFDPMVRKQLYRVCNKIYFGNNLIPNFDRSPDNNVDNTQVNNINISLSRPFGEPGQVLDNNNNVIQFVPQIGLLRQQDVPKDLMLKQPRSQLAVSLPETSDNTIRNRLIQLCEQVDMHIVQNGILKVNQQQLNQILPIINAHENGRLIRSFLSESIRIQYHNNYKICQQLQSVNQETQIPQEHENELNHQNFKQLVDRVIKIKTEGNAAVVILMNLADKSIEKQQKDLLKKTFEKKDKIIGQMRKMLMKFYTDNNSNIDWNALGFNDNELDILRNPNKFLSSYNSKNDKPSSIVDRNLQMVGSGYQYDVNQYYTLMTRYVNAIENYMVSMKHASNFAELFGLFAELEYESADMVEQTKETIKQAVYHFLMGQMVDINESIMKYDFDVTLKPAVDNVINAQNPLLIGQTQLNVTCKDDSKMKLIGIDCIYIPHNWVTSGGPVTQGGHVANPDGHNRDLNPIKLLVPQFESQITRDFNQLFLQTVDAMCQRMINYIALYRLSVKKDQPFNIHRISFGAAKKRSKSLTQSSVNVVSFDTIALDPKKSKQITLHQYESYYRIALVCQYYIQLFADINEAVQLQTPNNNNVVLYHFNTQGQDIESKIYNLVQAQLRDGHLRFNRQTMQSFIQLVNQFMSKLNTTYYYDVAQAMILFVNQNYGIVNVADNAKITQLNQQHQQKVEGTVLGIQQLMNPRDVIENGLNTIQLDDHLQYLSPLLQNVNSEQHSDYNVHIHRLIQITTQQLSNQLENIENVQALHMHKTISTRYSVITQVSDDQTEIINDLVELFNNGLTNVSNDFNNPIRLHEQTLFSYRTFNLIITQIAAFQEMTNQQIQDLDMNDQGIIARPNVRLLERNVLGFARQVQQIANQIKMEGLVDVSVNFEDLYDNQGDLVLAIADVPITFRMFCERHLKLDYRQLINKLQQLSASISAQLRLYPNDNNIIHRAIQEYNRLGHAPERRVNDEQDRLNMVNDLIMYMGQQIQQSIDILQPFNVHIEGNGMRGGTQSELMPLIDEKSKYTVTKQEDQPKQVHNTYLIDIQQQQQPAAAVQQELIQPIGMNTGAQPKQQQYNVKITAGDRDLLVLQIAKIKTDPSNKPKVTKRQLDDYTRKYPQKSDSDSLQDMMQQQQKSITESEGKDNYMITLYNKTDETADMLQWKIIGIKDDENEEVCFIISQPDDLKYLDINIDVQGSSQLKVPGKVLQSAASDSNEFTFGDLQSRVDRLKQNGDGPMKGGLLGNANIITSHDQYFEQLSIDQLSILGEQQHNLIYNFDYDYTLLGAYSENPTHDIFVCNKILHEYFTQYKWVLKSQDIFGNFIRNISSGSNVVKQYMQTYGKVIPADIRIMKDVMRTNGQTSGNVQIPEYIQQHGVTLDLMINNLLYDGSHQLKDFLQFTDIRLHNDVILRNHQNADQVCMITSSLVNFVSQWQQQNQGIDLIPISTIIAQMDINDLMVLVSSSIMCKHNIEALLERVTDKYAMQTNLQNHLKQALQRYQAGAAPNVGVVNQLQQKIQTVQGQLLLSRRVMQFIKNDIITQLDDIIKNNVHILPDYFLTSKNGNNSQALMSNLIHLMDFNVHDQDRHDRAVQEINEQHLLQYSKFLYLMQTEGNVSTQAIKLDNKYVNYDTLVRMIPFMKSLMKTSQSMKYSMFNRDYYISYRYLDMLNKVTNFNMRQANIRRIDILNQGCEPYWCRLPPAFYLNDAFEQYSDPAQIHPINTTPFVPFGPRVPPLHPLPVAAAAPVAPGVVDQPNQALRDHQLMNYNRMIESRTACRVTLGRMINQVHDFDVREQLGALRINNGINTTFHMLYQYQPHPQYQHQLALRHIGNTTFNSNMHILRQISEFMQNNVNIPDVVQGNILEIGIVPINMNMLKKDVGLINISLYSQVFNNTMNIMMRPPTPAGVQPVDNLFLQLQNQINARVGSHVNLVNRLVTRDVNHNGVVVPQHEIVQLAAYSQIMQRILQQMNVPVDNRVAIVDQVQQSLHVKIYFVMYMMVAYMIQGVIPDNTDFTLDDMLESLIQNPAIDMGANNMARRPNRII